LRARQNNLKSKDKDTVRAAQAYGDPNKDNGTTIRFGDPGGGKDAATKHDLGVDPNDQTKVRAVETVTIKEDLIGSRLEAAVGHEGTHVADAQDFVATFSGADYWDLSKNLNTYQRELRAFLVTASILRAANEKIEVGDCGTRDPCMLGKGMTQAQTLDTINRLLSNKPYQVTPNNPGPRMYGGRYIC
jgi:hypothetical protein